MSDGPITTHVLDTAQGTPAAGVAVQLLNQDGHELAAGVTDDCGRLAGLMPEGAIEPGTYRLRFDTAGYARANGQATFYPEVVITFTIASREDHFHVPLLLSPFGYTTYRGSR